MIVALEGIDGSGKGTQAGLLRDRLNEQKFLTTLLSFPRYEQTRFGRKIGEFLDGKLGPVDPVHPVFTSLLYAGDRLESRQAILEAVEFADLLILDRYVPSNMAHQACRLGSEAEQDELLQWIEFVEYQHHGLPRPDLVIVLDTPVDTAQELVARKPVRTYTDQTLDAHEGDAPYLTRVRAMYHHLAEQNANWQIVSSVDEQGLRSVQAIHDEVFHCVWSAWQIQQRMSGGAGV